MRRAQDVLLGLAGGRARDRLDEDDPGRPLEAREVLRAVGHDLGVVGVVGHDEGHAAFAPSGVRHADNGNVAHPGMGADDRLFLSDPVYQGGTVDRSRGSDWLAEQIRAKGGKAEHVPDRAAIGEKLLGKARSGDRILIMGARDDTLAEFARELVERLDR